jgi:hypothetical protein
MESRRRAIARLQAQLEQNSGRISGIEQAQAIVSSAKFNHLHGRRCPNCKCTQGHWIASNGQDFGSTLPAVDTISLAGLRKLALQAQEEIARHNAAITTLQSGKSSTALALESIQNLRTQLVTETANAKASLLEQPIGIEVASAAANTRMVQAAANPPPESVQTAQRTESRPRVAQETIPQSPQRTAPQSPKPWWQEFWYLIVIGIVGTIYILRH